ncbi:hypothetical protein K435DRAFT_798559 [Dendrothele bispora CBS 962.96]|uniref:Uncharacterized protein n=1 Tax=Dendrothele bispora (strain CBS 962.96) TaxID=1314807 RepID=A0A4S8M031_DENBC|nr:hypothetical protein K435DRAFT_798559 [Dendrothele bispora CBS 962.96]
MLSHGRRHAGLARRSPLRLKPDLRPRFSPTAIGFGGNNHDGDADDDNGNPFGFPFNTFGPNTQLPTATTNPLTLTAPSVQRPTSSVTPVTFQSLTSSATPQTTLAQTPSSPSSSPGISAPTPATSPARISSTPINTPVSSSPGFASQRQGDSSTSSANVAAASSNGSSQNKSSSNAGLIGGVIAGVLALIFLCLAVGFIMRRRGRKEDRAFHAANFRRSALILHDPPSPPAGVDDTVQQRFHGPGMSEKQFMEGHMSFGTQYGAPGPYGQAPDPTYGYDATRQHHPDHYLEEQYQQQQYQQSYGQPHPYQQQSQPQTPNSSSYLLSSPIAPSLESPNAGAFGPGAYGAAMHQNIPPQLLGTQFLGKASREEDESDKTLSRKTSSNTLATKATRSSAHSTNHMQAHTSQYATYPDLSQDAARRSVPLPSSEYLDLSRTSVTPFQAAQYYEISKRISSSPPEGLDTPAVDAYMQAHPEARRRSGSASASEKDVVGGAVSPFKDPEPAQSSKSETETGTRRESKRESKRESRRTIDSQDVSEEGDLDFPVPPSPSVTKSSRYNFDIPPTPPTLPEIRVQSRTSFGSYDFSNVYPRTSQMTNVSLSMNGFPTTPSPLASSFVIHTPMAEKQEFGKEDIAVPRADAEDRKDGQKRPDTVYDPEDAYGGI